MSKQKPESTVVSAERSALRRRIKSFYRYLNLHEFEKCCSFLDPSLRQQGRVEEHQYVKSLVEFLDYYGTVNIQFVKIELYLGVQAKAGKQDCAYPLIVWKDGKHVPHLFRERWVKDGGTWYTRVAGLVTPDTNGTEGHERQRHPRSRRRSES